MTLNVRRVRRCRAFRETSTPRVLCAVAADDAASGAPTHATTKIHSLINFDLYNKIIEKYYKHLIWYVVRVQYAYLLLLLPWWSAPNLFSLPTVASSFPCDPRYTSCSRPPSKTKHKLLSLSTRDFLTAKQNNVIRPIGGAPRDFRRKREIDSKAFMKNTLLCFLYKYM